jgi:hypothetical protein
MLEACNVSSRWLTEAKETLLELQSPAIVGNLVFVLLFLALSVLSVP